MMSDAEHGLFDMVVVKDISRFARNTVDLLQNVRKLKSLGIETQFLTANMTSMGNSEFVLTIFGALAQEESANTSKRVKFGKKMNAEKGRVPNIVYGYDKTIGDYFNLEINESEAKVEGFQKVKENEDKVDKYEDIIGTYLVKLSRETLNDADSHQVSNLLHCIGDLERISDHAMYVARSAEELHTKGIAFSEAAVADLAVVSGALTELLGLTYNAFSGNNLEVAKSIEPLEQVIDNLKIKVKNHHIERLQNNICTIENGFVFNDVLTSFVRTADHCSNIGVCLLEIANGSYETHQYLNHVKFNGENDFAAKYAKYKAKYIMGD